MNIAQNLNLSWTGFYPFVNIFGRQIKTAVYIANPIAIQGNIIIIPEASKLTASINPASSPALTNPNNLTDNSSSTWAHANKSPEISEKIPYEKFKTDPNIQKISNSAQSDDSLCSTVTKYAL